MSRRRAVLAAVLLSGVVLSACAPALAAYGPWHDWPVALLAALLPWAILPLCGLLLVAAATRRWLVAGAAAIVLAAHVALLLPFEVGAPRGGPDPIVVMTANLYFGEADAAKVVEQVRDRRVTFLGLEELTPSAVRRLHAAGLDALLPYSLVDAADGSGGSGLWAARPLARAPAWPTQAHSTAGVASVNGRELTLMVLHPRRPGPDQDGTRLADFRGLRRAAGGDPHAASTVLLGDMNASVHDPELRGLMGDRWRDAAEVVGAGVVRTWTPSPLLPALIDLDHILVPPGVRVRNVTIVGVAGSDHSAILAELAFTG